MKKANARPQPPLTERPVLAIAATPGFKGDSECQDALRLFVMQHLFTLASHFRIISTGRTHTHISKILKDYGHFTPAEESYVASDMGVNKPTATVLKRWSTTIQKNFVGKKAGISGMIEVVHELVRGKVQAVISFSRADDIVVRAGTAVLRREANVYNVPIASDIGTANDMVRYFKRQIAAGELQFASPRRQKAVDLEKLLAPHAGDDVLALIAHDGSKPEMGRFVVERAKELSRFKAILATGNTGQVAINMLTAAGYSSTAKKVIPCKSGPDGGDVEIAAAVVRGQCCNVLFFQDPKSPHPHVADIHLLEQAALEISVRFATNAATAAIVLER